MRRKESRPIQKVSLNLFTDDMAKLRALHPRLGAGKVIRELVAAHIKRVEEQAAQSAGVVPNIVIAKDLL